VLDDYHVIDSPPVHESLRFLLEHRPPGLQLALTSRSDPPLALARLRGRGQLAELRAVDLRFTSEEAAALLRQVAAPGAARPDASLPGAVAVALAARTEGWAAGLQLAGLSLRGHDDAGSFVAAFTGSHRYVLDYLAEEILERQPGQVREFLLETSVLERLPGGLCDAVTGRPGSQALLEQAERAGLFAVPLDEVRGWWRYHHLFADLLRARLQTEQPGRVAGLHRNAAAWYADRGLADALTLGCPQHYVRVFVDEGAPMAGLLARLIAARRSGGPAAQVPVGCLAWLQRRLGGRDIAPDASRGRVAAVPGLVEQLTRRELEVLGMLATGKSNQAIASQLVITLDTVKKHVSHVLDKLGAANRTEAVARARELGLIP